jgi:hypothetical protein
MGSRVWIGAWAVWLQIPARALGAPPSVALDLQYVAPQFCPPASDFSAAVARLVGGPEQPSRNLKARVTVLSDTRGNFKLTLLTEIDGISGERVIQGRSCSSVADAAALTLALILNPDIETATDAGTASNSQPTQVQRAATVPPRAPTTKAEQLRPVPSKGQSIRWLGTSALGLHFGVMPKPGPEISLGLGANFGRWSWLASGHYALPETALIPGQDRAGGRLWHGTVTGLGCWAFAADAPRLGGCVGASYTRIEGQGKGITPARKGATAWVSPTTGIFVDFPLGERAALRWDGLLLVPLKRPDAHLDDMGTVQRPSALTANFQVGVIVQLP